MSDAVENFFSLAHRLADCQNEHPDAAPLPAAYPDAEALAGRITPMPPRFHSPASPFAGVPFHFDAEAPDAPHLAEPSPHKNLDPVTGNCLDCGATREEIDDRLVSTCDVIAGPNKDALMAVRRTIWRREWEIAQHAAELERAEDGVARMSNHLRTARHDLELLKASFEKLRAAE